MSSPLDNFENQSRACARLGSPFTAALCRAIPAAMGETRLAAVLRGWQGDAALDALALRACGGLHALVLTGAAPELAALYPPHETDAAALHAVLTATIAEHDGFLTDYLDKPPQTNETGRSAMILGAALIVAQATGLPLDVFEVGASAGLNLLFSHYDYDLGDGREWHAPDAPLTITSDWSGALPPLDQTLRVVARKGCDRNPLAPGNPDDRLRLLSYIWPDQAARLARMRAALDHAAHQTVSVDADDAAAWIERQVQEAPVPGTARMFYHTIVWQYLPDTVRDRITTALQQAGAAATADTPLAWFRFETDQGASGDGALMELTLWPGGETRVLGRADFHGRWVRWA